MPLKSVLRASCLVGILVIGRAAAAPRVSPLVGQTRDQVINRLGEPDGDIVAGAREVLVFPTERIVLQAGRVAEVEETVLVLPPPPVVAAPAANDQGAVAASGPAAPAPLGNATATAPSPGLPAPAETAATASAEPQVVIKSIRPPSADDEGAGESPAPAADVATGAAPTAVKPPAPLANRAPLVAKSSPAGQPTAASAAPASSAARPPAATHPAPSAAGPAPAGPRRPPAVSRPEPTAAPATPPASSGVSTDRTYAIAIIVIVAGVIYLVWRRRNRRLILAATAVSSDSTPFQPMTLGAARFTQDLLGRLEWKRFEELVAAYYNKTGVQAVRTTSGPAAPVHVRISWKGEQRPFALVQCIARPAALIDAKPVQALCEVLAAEDIRRGYVVTSGKFGVTARDLAEEKHVTLLSGDIFLEKLNALPDPVRAELMRDITRGDYVTPTCPRCDVKMVHPPGDPDGWQCPQCGAVLPRA